MNLWEGTGFYLNGVGYKVTYNSRSSLFADEFYLNGVGYKVTNTYN